jgi:hypothetical protein
MQLNAELQYIHDEKMEANDVSHYQRIFPKKLWKKLNDDFYLPMLKAKIILLNLIILNKIQMVAF